MAVYNSTASGGNGVRAGVASLEINGEAVDVVGDLQYDATTLKLEELIGQSGPQGFSAMPKNGMISGTIRDAGNLSQQNFVTGIPVPLVAVLANGKTVYGTSLVCTECSAVKTQEATFDVTYKGLVTESST